MRLIAFLRAINVGGHVVRMEQLRQVVSSLGFGNVETFIASGNLVFDGRASQAGAAERKIEATLRATLGYDVATFVRTDVELGAVASRTGFSPAEMAGARTFNVGFLKAPLVAAESRRLMALSSDVDAFETAGREIYWLCKVGQSESKFSNVRFERAVGVPATFRNITTLKKMTAKYPPAGR